MAKGFGIAALVFALLAIPLPFGFVLSAIAMICAAIAALAGDRGFAIASLVIAAVNTFVLSPTTYMFLHGGDPGARAFFVTLVLIFGALPIVAIVLNSSGKLVLRS